MGQYGEVTVYSHRAEAKIEFEFIKLSKLRLDEIKDELSIYQFILD